jgi:hypothetical protein
MDTGFQHLTHGYSHESSPDVWVTPPRIPILQSD